MSDRSLSPGDHDDLDLVSDHISIEDSEHRESSQEREAEDSLDIKPPQAHSSGSRKERHKQKKKDTKQKDRRRDKEGAQLKSDRVEKVKHRDRGREKEKDGKAWRDPPREKVKEDVRERDRPKEDNRNWERERERQKEDARERERDARERERMIEETWKRDRERQEEDADREVKRREKSRRERERLETLERQRHRLDRERQQHEREHRERMMREREKQDMANKNMRDARARREHKRVNTRQELDRRRERDKGQGRSDEYSDNRSRSPHMRKDRYVDKRVRDEPERSKRPEPKGRIVHLVDPNEPLPELEGQRSSGARRSPILPPADSEEEIDEEDEDMHEEEARHDSDKYMESPSTSDSQSDSHSLSGTESDHSRSSPRQGDRAYRDGHVPSKFDDEVESEEEEELEEEEEMEKEASETESGHLSEPEDVDDMMYALDATPPASPVELAPKLPVYYPAIHGCRNVEQFHCLNRIEEGTYGVVYRARDKQKDEIVALKRLKMEKEKEGFPITSLREINTLLKSQHPNIVTVREIVVGSNMDKIYIVMDYVEHDLKSLMETMKEPFIIGEVKTLMLQLQRGVSHLHDNWIIHRDLKTSNLLLSHKGILKIGDFGLAREYGSPLKQYTPIVVTLWYRAPELLLGTKEYSTAIDMWSVGCIMAEFLTRKPLFPGKSEMDELNRIFKELGTPNEKIWPNVSDLPIMKKCTFSEYPYNQLRNRFGTHISDKGFDLMNRFLTYDPTRRITAEESRKHEWFKETPLPTSPSMFPTWPAKSEQNRRSHGNSPKPPSGGKAFSKLLGDDDEHIQGFHLVTATKGAAAAGAGFSLKF